MVTGSYNKEFVNMFFPWFLDEIFQHETNAQDETLAYDEHRISECLQSSGDLSISTQNEDEQDGISAVLSPKILLIDQDICLSSSGANEFLSIGSLGTCGPTLSPKFPPYENFNDK
jgi:hypothetical protein